MAKLRKTTKPPRPKGQAPIRPIRIMISSRCNDKFPAKASTTLTEARRKIKDCLKSQTLFGRNIFEVWINEDEPAVPSQDGWDKCMAEVDRCDILVVLFNGNAGWAVGPGDTGICHGEFHRGHSRAPGKVYLIQLEEKADIEKFSRPIDRRFQGDVDLVGAFRASVSTTKQLVMEVRETVAHAVTDLVGLGVRETRRGQYHLGEALKWSKFDYRTRESAIREALGNAMKLNGGSALNDRLVSYPIGKKQILFRLHAIPAAMSISTAREMVGRPFLRDHDDLVHLKSAAGPVHIIGCNRTCTETQAANLMGFPDATIVRGPFGVYVADEVQKIQFVLLENCRDDALTRIAFQRFVGWLDQSGEGQVLSKRADARKRIIEAIAAEY